MSKLTLEPPSDSDATVAARHLCVLLATERPDLWPVLNAASLGGAIHIVPPMNFKTAYVVPYAARIKRQVRIPVFVTGRKLKAGQIVHCEIVATSEYDLVAVAVGTPR